MPNMSYCRMQNTWRDLSDCENAMANDGMDELSEDEKFYAEKLYETCKAFIHEYEYANNIVNED